MNLSDTFTPLVERFRRHVSQEMVSNERLVLLFAGAVVVVVLVFIGTVWGLTSSKRAELVRSRTALARLQAEVTGDAWPKRLETTQALKAQLAVLIWDAPTPGLAEADFDSWIRNRFKKFGGAPQQITITRSGVARDGQPSPTISALQRMTAKVIAPFDQAVVTQLLADIAEADKLIVVDRLIIRSGANSRVEMDLSTFIRSADASAGAK